MQIIRRFPATRTSLLKVISDSFQSPNILELGSNSFFRDIYLTWKPLMRSYVVELWFEMLFPTGRIKWWIIYGLSFLYFWVIHHKNKFCKSTWLERTRVQQRHILCSPGRYFHSACMVIRKFIQISRFSGYIDAGDGCWRRNLLKPTIFLHFFTNIQMSFTNSKSPT